MMYNIQVDKETLSIISNALESYARLRCGQLDKLSNMFMEKDFNIQDVDYCLSQAKILLFPELQNCEYIGIYGSKAPKDAKILWDCYKVLAHQLNKDNVEWNVNSSPHMFASDKDIKVEEVV